MVVRWVWLDLEKKYKRKFLKKGRAKFKKNKKSNHASLCGWHMVGTKKKSMVIQSHTSPIAIMR